MAKPVKVTVNSEETLSRALSSLRKLFREKKYVRVTMMTGRDRSADQNALFHRWLQQLVEEHGEMTFNEYRNFCRLQFFVRMLVEENEDFKSLWFRLFPTEGQDKAGRYRLQLDFLSTFEGVSSICTTDQFSRALERMQEHFSTLDTDPVFLEWPDE